MWLPSRSHSATGGGKFVGCSNSGDGFIVNSWQRWCTMNNMDWFAKLVAVVDLEGWHPGKVVTALSGEISTDLENPEKRWLHFDEFGCTGLLFVSSLIRPNQEYKHHPRIEMSR